MTKSQCPKGHLVLGKICRACGYIVPFQVGEQINGYRVTHSQTEENRYQVEKDSRTLQLREVHDIYTPSYRHALMALFREIESSLLLPVLDYWIDESHEDSHLLYVVQPAIPGQQLDQMIELQGMLLAQQIKMIIQTLLEGLQELEVRHLRINGLTSRHIFLDAENIFIEFPIHGDKIENGQTVQTPIAHMGFSPSEQFRQGYLAPGCDRFALSMVLFHLLTGIHPALWHPGFPDLLAYSYMWGKDTVNFFQVLQRSNSIDGLIEKWKNLPLVLRNDEQYETYCQEIKQFYQAYHHHQDGRFQEALADFVQIREPVLSNPHIDRFIGKILWKQGKKTEAMLHYWYAARRDNMGVLFLEMGEYYYQDGVLDKSSEAYKRARKLLPFNPAAYNGLARNYAAQQRFQQASSWFHRSLQVKPTQAAREGLNAIARKQGLEPPFPSSPNLASFNLHSWNLFPIETPPDLLCPEGHSNASTATHCHFCNSPLAHQPGEWVSEYRIEKILVERDISLRRNSSTYLVFSEQKQHQFLLKDMLINHSGRIRYQNELKWLNELKHPSIPDVYDSFERNQRQYMVMSFCPGIDLHQYVQENGPLSEATVRGIFSKMAHILHFLQLSGVIHSDIKPKNILWEPESSHLTLLDFDIAVAFDPQKKPYAESLGATYDYAPPEQLKRNRVNLTTDLFSLGLCCVYLLTGLTPELFFYHGNRSYRRWETYTTISPAFRELIGELIVGKPAKRRFQNAQELLAFLPQIDTVEPLPQQAQQISHSKALQQLIRCRDIKVLEPLANQILKEQPNARVFYILGYVYQRVGDTKTALNYYFLSSRSDPAYLYTYWVASDILIAQGNLNKALDVLNRSLEICDQEALTYAMLGRLLSRMLRIKEAVAAYQRAIRVNPYFLDTYADLASLFLMTDNLGNAREVCERMLSLNTSSAKAYQLLGMIYGRQQHFENAVQAGQKSVLLEPESLGSHYNLGVSYFGARQFQMAAQQFEKCLEIKPDHYQSHYFLGSAYLYLGNSKSARTHLEEAMKANIQVELIQHKLEQLQTAHD